MHSLSPVSLQSRLRLDFDQIMRLSDDANAPLTASGHRTVANAIADRDRVDGSAANPPTAYRLEYRVPTLRGPGQRYDGTTVIVMDLLANANYPFTPPACYVVSSPAPFTPHFDNRPVPIHERYPVCIGRGAWLSSGRRTATDLVIHVGRLLNFDEPPPAPGYSGYNGAAIAWWQTTGFRPLDPDLVWPVLDPNSGAGRSRVHSATSASPGAGRGVRSARSAPPGVRTVRGGDTPSPASRPRTVA